ncbi:MAG TPA: hypothetical protein VGB37_17445 [Candidatus Lokiarchaeia archaeon]
MPRKKENKIDYTRRDFCPLCYKEINLEYQHAIVCPARKNDQKFAHILGE